MAAQNKDIVANDDYLASGDSNVYSIEIPHRGWDEFTSITVTSTGTTGTRTLEESIRYSKDGGIVWTDWSDTSILPISATTYDDLLIEVRLTRGGADATGVINVTNVRITGNFEQTLFDALSFAGTPFSEIAYDDYDWNKIWLNLYHKLYYRGIIPEYVIRNEDERFDETDFKAMIKIIAYFNALIIRLGEIKLDGFLSSQDNIISLLTQRGINIRDNETLADLTYILNNLYAELRLRGTFRIFGEAGGSVQVDGEWLRLVGWDGTSFYQWEYLPTQYSTYVVDEVPMTVPESFDRLAHIQLNQAPVDADDVRDIDVASWSITSGAFAEQVIDGKKTGLLTLGDEAFFIVNVNPSVSYKLSFYAYLNSDGISVNIQGIDNLFGGGNRTNALLTDGNIVPTPDNSFMVDANVAPLIFTYMEIVIYSVDQDLSDPLFDYKNPLYDTLGVSNAKFADREVDQLKISFFNNLGADMNIWDVKFLPLRLENGADRIDGRRRFNAYIEKGSNSLTKQGYHREMIDKLLGLGSTQNTFFPYDFSLTAKNVLFNKTLLYLNSLNVIAAPATPANSEIRDLSGNMNHPAEVGVGTGVDYNIKVLYFQGIGAEQYLVLPDGSFPSGGSTRTIICAARRFDGRYFLGGGAVGGDVFEVEWDAGTTALTSKLTFRFGAEEFVYDNLLDNAGASYDLWVMRIDTDNNINLRWNSEDVDSGQPVTTLNTGTGTYNMGWPTGVALEEWEGTLATFVVAPFFLTRNQLYSIENYFNTHLESPLGLTINLSQK